MDEGDGIEDVKLKMYPDACVEKARLGWCCDEGNGSSLAGAWNQTQNSSSASVYETFDFEWTVGVRI